MPASDHQTITPGLHDLPEPAALTQPRPMHVAKHGDTCWGLFTGKGRPPLMPANTRNADLHGNVPDEAKTALLIIDMINDFAFPDGEALLRYALPVAARIAMLKQRARQAGVPAISSCNANDNVYALAQMRKVLKADTCASTELDFRQLNHET